MTTMIKIMTVCASFAAAPAFAAANLLPGDTSFEAGPEEWLGGRSVACADAPSGRYALELSRPYNHSRIYYGLVKAGQPYALTFSARCPTGPATIKVTAWHVLYNRVSKPQSFQLDRAWQRFSLPFQTQKQNRDVYFTVELPPGTKVELDNLMLADKADAAYLPPHAPVLSIAPTGKPGNMLLAGDPAPVLEIGVAGNAVGFAGRLSCRTVDFYGRTCGELVSEVNLKPGETQRLNYPALPGTERGYYLVTAELTGADGKVATSARQSFGVVPQPVKLSPEKSFFGLHPDTSRVEMAAIPRIGAKWLRIFYPWKILEPQSGKVVPMPSRDAAEQGLAIFACLRLFGAPPAWVPRQGKYLADFNALTAFLPVLARLAPADVKAWEIENEPDLCYPSLLGIPYREAADYYGKLANAAGNALKQAEPVRPVAAISCSGNANDADFVKQAMSRCEKAFDILTVHPYTGARYIGPGLRAVAPDAYIREQLLGKAKLCRGKKLWAGEIGWAYDVREPVDSEAIRTFSDYVARALILIRSVPEVEKVMWFKAQGCYERDYYQYGIWRSEFEPLPAAVFYAGIAERLDTARPLKPIFEADIRAYAFVAADGRPFAAVWKYKGDTGELLIDAEPARVRLIDLFGLPVKLAAKDGRTVVPLSSTPAWLEVDGVDADGLIKQLAATKINTAPATINVYFRDGDRIDGVLRNNLPKPQTVTLEMNNSAVPPQKFDIAASGTRSFSFRLPENKEKYRLKAVAEVGVTRYDDSGDYFACVASGGDWNALLRGPGVIELKERRYIYPPDPNIGWNSPSDLSGRFGCGWDRHYFYFVAEVNDPVHFQPSESYRAWNGDSLQLAFDTMNDAAEGVFEFNANDVEFIAWLSPQGPRLAKTFSPLGDVGKPVKNAKIEITRKNNVTGYHIALPWSAMAELTPLPGRIFGMNFIVNQNNGQGRRYWLGLSEGLGEVKYPWLYRRFILAPKAGAK